VGLIAYSLGNILSNQSRYYSHPANKKETGNPRDSILLGFTAIRKKLGADTIVTEVADVTAYPVWSENNALERRRGTGIPTVITVRSIDAALSRLSSDLAKPELAPDEKIRLLKEQELYRVRREAISGIIGEDWLPADIETR
jgi:poly-gamma-glutamate synthesis protein (capsule biosynthesis protein)